MNDFSSLFAAALQQPDDVPVRLVLADWLEESGNAENQARADLIRLQIEYEKSQSPNLNHKAAQLLKEHRGLVAQLRPILRRGVALLELNPGLLVVLGAGVQAEPGGIEAESVWVGHLYQGANSYPTTLTIRKRKGNAIVGDMEQDFDSLMPGWTGRFFFRGVVAARSLLTFATYRLEGGAAGPGLYQLTLGKGDWLQGTWWVPPGDFRGEMTLRRRKEA